MRELDQQELLENSRLIEEVQTTSIHRLQTAMGLLQNTVDQLNAVADLNSQNKGIIQEESSGSQS